MQADQQLHEFARLRANLNDPSFPDLMLHVVVETIKKNPGITLNALCFHLTDCLYFPKNRVTSAVGVLTSLYSCVTRRNVPSGDRRVTYLTYVEREEFEQWHTQLLASIPCLSTFVAPSAGARRKPGDAA